MSFERSEDVDSLLACLIIVLDAVRANAAVYVLAYSKQIALMVRLQPFHVLKIIPVLTNGWRVDSFVMLISMDRVIIPVRGCDDRRRR